MVFCFVFFLCNWFLSMWRVKFFPAAEGNLSQGFNTQCVANVDSVDAEGIVFCSSPHL